MKEPDRATFPRILIVDDQQSFRMMIRHYLQEPTGIIHECTDGQQAVLHYMESPVDIVIMDVNMPTMDGITATRHIRAYDPQARIVIQSSHSAYEFHAVAIEAGASAFISKTRLKELPAIVDTLLADRDNRQSEAVTEAK